MFDSFEKVDFNINFEILKFVENFQFLFLILEF